MWHNNDTRQDSYNNWNFTDIGPWDTNGKEALWWNVNTTVLGNTQRYRIGYETIDKIDLSLKPESTRLVNRNVSSSVLGFPISWNDVIYQKVTYKQTTDINSDYECPKASKYNSTNIIFNLNFDFVESQYIVNYYTFEDVVSTLGGILATIGIIAS